MHWLLMMMLLALAASPAQAQAQQSCTPDAYMAEQIEKSMKACDTIIADPRRTAMHKVQAYQYRGDLYLRKQEYSSSLQNFNQAIALLGS